MIYNEVIGILRSKAVDFRIHKHQSVITMRDVEEKLSFPKEKLLKTLIFRVRTSFWVLAVVKSRDEVDYQKLARVLGVRHEDIVKPSKEELRSQTEFQVGGICPIPTDASMKVIFDTSILDIDVAYCGIGSNDRSLEIRVQDLLQVSNAIVEPIAH